MYHTRGTIWLSFHEELLRDKTLWILALAAHLNHAEDEEESKSNMHQRKNDDALKNYNCTDIPLITPIFRQVNKNVKHLKVLDFWIEIFNGILIFNFNWWSWGLLLNGQLCTVQINPSTKTLILKGQPSKVRPFTSLIWSHNRLNWFWKDLSRGLG